MDEAESDQVDEASLTRWMKASDGRSGLLTYGECVSAQRAAAGAVDPGALPALVRGHAERALGGGTDVGRTVRVTQEGEMILKPGARPRSFSAVEEFATDRVAFSWRARFPVVGPLALRVTDSYGDGRGLLEVRALGLPLQRQHGAELALGEAFRYLAEIAWVPHAILANVELQWRQFEDRVVEVGTSVGAQRAAVQLHFNEQGEIARTVAERPRAEAGNARTAWVGEFSDYRDFGGALVPEHGAVRWELPEGPFTYWRGTISSLETRA